MNFSFKNGAKIGNYNKNSNNHNKKAPTTFVIEALDKRRRLPTLPHCIAVPSAQVSLTSLFGMGRGGTSPQ